MLSRESRLTLFIFILLFLTVGSTLAAQVLSPFTIRINIAARRLDLLFGERVVKEYPVAVGKSTTPSTEGAFTIINKVIDPTWYPEGRIPVVPGPDNPVGSRWLGLSAPGYGIHGTNNPSSIGQAISGGCFRMHNRDVEQLFNLVSKGTKVELIYEPIEVTREPSEFSPIVVRINPDIYKRGQNTPERLRELLQSTGYAGELAAPAIEGLLRKPDGAPRLVPAKYSAELNGITFDFDLPVELGRLRIDGLALARLLGAERTGLAAMSYLLEHGWLLTPEVAASLFRLAVSVDVQQGRVKFSAPCIRVKSGNTFVAEVSDDGAVNVPSKAPFTVVLTQADLPYPQVMVTVSGTGLPQGGSLIGDMVWVDLEQLAAAGLNFVYQWLPEPGILRINGEEVAPVVKFAGKPLVPLATLRKILEPGWVDTPVQTDLEHQFAKDLVS